MLGLYIHIPFCIKKCEYCDFVSFPCMEDKFEKYINALINEMDEYSGAELDTIFIGGGTPSVLSAGLIKKLCDAIHEKFNIASGYEWTIEANPGTLNDEKIRAMLDGGINRISVGVQSFNDNELKAIGRIHDAKTAYNNICRLNELGFKNISLDLMESLPYQTEESFAASLKTAVQLPVSHISVYSLIIEEGTPLKQKYDEGIYELPDEDTDRDLYGYTEKYLEQFGMYRYEISNYAKPGFESRHNMRYWKCEEYIGLGLAAHSYLNGKRFSNTSELNEYIGGSYRSGECEILNKNDMMSEFMILGMRMMTGVSADEFRRRFGQDIENVYGDVLNKYIKNGFIGHNKNRYFFTNKGIDVSNSILCEFM